MAQEAHNAGAAPNGAAVKEVVFKVAKPWLFVEAPKANDAVQFYKVAFGAEEVNRTVHPKRKAEQELPLLLSAELKLGSFSFLVSDLIADDSRAPVKTVGGGVAFCLETEEVEAAVEKAVGAGAISEDVSEADCCGGDGRVVKLKDPYGNVWLVCSPASASADVEA
ncbi:uncharacterized protein At5g48480 [Coffea eugenioides]|uniref:Uncharacterized protein At5g48480 n=1 Tax=Coffea arabica TaxID=13443 RepID=A0A6P6UQ22_COFAR|nr:uncharacterized protein At5g48480-like [Coffea arabica]XP_027161876.1 uncharacterized protein At5g48480 [Coffea eugenioides]